MPIDRLFDVMLAELLKMGAVTLEDAPDGSGIMIVEKETGVSLTKKEMESMHWKKTQEPPHAE